MPNLTKANDVCKPLTPFTPIGQGLKAFNAGRAAFLAGEDFDSNPFTHFPKVSTSAWWETGWKRERREQEERTSAERIQRDQLFFRASG
jgi:hypothetical protein